MEEIAPDVVGAICQSCLVRSCPLSDPIQCCLTLVESSSVSADAIPEGYATETQRSLPVILSLSQLNLKEKQRADPSLQEVIHQMETGEKIPPTWRHEFPEVAPLLREWNHLELCNGVVYRRRQKDEQISFQLVLVKELLPMVLTSLHNDVGHLRIERTLLV